MSCAVAAYGPLIIRCQPKILLAAVTNSGFTRLKWLFSCVTIPMQERRTVIYYKSVIMPTRPRMQQKKYGNSVMPAEWGCWA
jgi:hypothetical protein